MVDGHAVDASKGCDGMVWYEKDDAGLHGYTETPDEKIEKTTVSNERNQIWLQRLLL